VSGRFPAPFSNYQRIRQEQAAAQTSAAQTPDVKSDGRAGAQADRQVSRAEQPDRRKLTWKEQRELEQLEADIATLEHQKETLESALSDTGENYLRLQALANDLARLDSELEAALTRWFELSGD
jgi:ATP-binding cassette subfamily F protein uup